MLDGPGEPWPFPQWMPSENGGGHVQEQSTRQGKERSGKCGRSGGKHGATATLGRRTPPPATLEPTKAGTRSCIGSGMSIVGDIECNGPAQVFGRIKRELRASDLLIGDGAQVEGSVIAQDVTVCGRVKGTIRAVRVKLQDGGAV